MAKLETLNVVWIGGQCCDGCTISIYGAEAPVTLEALLTGAVPGMPKVVLHHTVVAVEAGEDHVRHLREAEQGKLHPLVLVVESSLPDDRFAGSGSFATLGRDGERRIPLGEWVQRIAPKAVAVISVGDCAVWGGPHSEDPNPSHSRGVFGVLGPGYKSALGLPLINLPGCAIEAHFFLETVVALVKYAQGEGEVPKLDNMGRPAWLYR